MLQTSFKDAAIMYTSSPRTSQLKTDRRTSAVEQRVEISGAYFANQLIESRRQIGDDDASLSGWCSTERIDSSSESSHLPAGNHYRRIDGRAPPARATHPVFRRTAAPPTVDAPQKPGSNSPAAERRPLATTTTTTTMNITSAPT